MDILIVNNFVLSAITLRKPLDESKAQLHQDGEAVFDFICDNGNETMLAE